MTSRGSYVVALHGLVLSCLLGVAVAAPAAQAAGCRFVLGFAALHDTIPSIVGPCVDDEQHNPANGDALQHTTNGLLVWRKHPQAGTRNFTAFTDGFRSWVSGPDGMQERLNTQRFAWEANSDNLPVVPSASPAGGGPPLLDRCHTGELAITRDGGGVGAGNVGATFRVRSLATLPCTLYGFPGAQLLDANKQPMQTTLTWSTSGYLIGTVPEARVVLRPGDSAYFVLEYADVPSPGDTCPASTYVEVTPPDEYTSITVPAQLAPCGGRMTASPILASRAGLP